MTAGLAVDAHDMLVTVIRRYRALRQMVYVGLPTLGLLLLMSGFFWWNLVESGEKLRHETMKQAELRGRQVNDTLAQAVSMLFLNVDGAVESMIDFYRLNKNVKAFEQQVDVLLGRFPAGAVMQVAVIDADGYLKYTNLETKDRVYLGDREHFAVHLNNPNPQLFISKPIMGRVSKKWTIQFSRPIFQAGQFLGVMVMSVSPEYLYRTLSSLTQDSQDVIMIQRSTGEVMARNYDFEQTIGRELPRDRPYMNAAPGDVGSYRVVSAVDQIERVYHWVRLKNYPVTVLLGMSVSNLTRVVDQSIANERIKGVFSTLALWAVSLLAVYLTLRMQSNVKKRMELEYAAHHDALTGLHNRKALLEHLNVLLQPAVGRQPRLALLFVDLDGFKPINDAYGHATGDELLKVVAQRMKRCARDNDFVARLGGDEFVLVMHEPRNDQEVNAFVRRIEQSLQIPVALDHEQLQVGASIGVAICPDQGQTTEQLMEAADREMYRVKNDRKTRAYASIAT